MEILNGREDRISSLAFLITARHEPQASKMHDKCF